MSSPRLAPNTTPPPKEVAAPPAYLVFDTESVPDGRLLNLVRYPDETLTPEEAIARAQEEGRKQSGSDFIPVTFQYPIAVCVLRVDAEYRLQALTCLDAPQFRPRKMVEQFWAGVVRYRAKLRDKLKLVTFNGYGFDLPLMEMAAFRYGIAGHAQLEAAGKRYESWHIDLMDWLTNRGSFRLAGGLNLLARLLGKPGKFAMKGDQVYRLFQEGRIQEINDHCLCDTLDTYFILLRSRVLAGEMTLEDEHRATMRAKEWLQGQADALPAVRAYLEHWAEWQPWP